MIAEGHREGKTSVLWSQAETFVSKGLLFDENGDEKSPLTHSKRYNRCVTLNTNEILVEIECIQTEKKLYLCVVRPFAVFQSVTHFARFDFQLASTLTVGHYYY